MRIALMLLLVAPCASAPDVFHVPVVQRAGVDYVSAFALERSAGIAIKTLPGDKRLVACAQDRCAPITKFIPSPDGPLVDAQALSDALGATARFTTDRKMVSFDLTGSDLAPSKAEVGRLAPDFKLARLDGPAIRLSDFRGKRVLINSWASW